MRRFIVFQTVVEEEHRKRDEEMFE